MSVRTAEKNNEKLFPLFRRNLTENNVNLYAATADKLALWAAREKAYYPYARPVIVELLETAHAQVRRHSNAPDKPFHISDTSEALKPWAEPFVKLVSTVAHFYFLFAEPQLQVRLRVLLQTIDIDPLAPDYLRQLAQHPSPYAVSRFTTDRVAQSASPMSRASPPMTPGPSIVAHSEVTPPVLGGAEMGASAASSLQHSVQGGQSNGLTTPPFPPPRNGSAAPPVSINVPLSFKQVSQRSPPPFSPGPSTPGVPAPMASPSIQSTNAAAPRAEPSQPAVAGPSSAAGTSPTVSATSSPAIAAATPGESSSAALLKRKLKKKKKRLTEDDFIMADLADWESARANKAAQPASPALPSMDPASRAGSISGVQPEPQTPRETQGPTTPTASDTGIAGMSETAGAYASNVVNEPQASSSAAPDAAMLKQPRPISTGETPAPPEPMTGPALATSVVPALVAEPAPSTPVLAIASPQDRPAEVDLRSQAPSSPRTSKKKRPSQEFRFVSQNGMPPKSTPVKRKKQSPGLVVLRVNPQPQPANGNAPEAVNGKEVGQKVEDSPHPELVETDIIMKDGDREPKRATAELQDSPMLEDVPALQQHAARLEPQQEPTLGRSELQGTLPGPAPYHANDHLSEDVVMADLVQNHAGEPVGPTAQPMEPDRGPSDEVPGVVNDSAMDVVVEDALGQSSDSGPSDVPIDQPMRSSVEEPRARVAESEALAPVPVHPQVHVVAKTRGEDTSMEVDTQLAVDGLQPTMTHTSTGPPPTIGQPYDGVIQELAEKKGMSADIVSRIVAAVAEETEPEFKLAPAEWPTETPSLTPSETTDDSVALAEPVVPRKRSRSSSRSADDIDGESSRKRRTKSTSPTPTSSVVAPLDGAPAPESAPTNGEPNPEPADSAEGKQIPERASVEATTVATDTQQDPPPPDKTMAEPVVAAELQPRSPDNAEAKTSREVYNDREDGEADENEEPPITLSAMPSSTQETVEEGEILTPTPPSPPTAVYSVSLPVVYLNSPPTYSELRVLECRRGSAEDEVAFQFDVSPELMAFLSRWAGRYKSTEDVSKERCVSFSCYPFNDCVDYIRARSKDVDRVSSYEKLCRSVVMKWPKDARLYAELQNSNGEHRLMLSPPFMRKTDQIVDLSDYVALGRNVLKVYQLRDYSDYIFTLNIHTPVPSQLQELQQRRDHDVHWKSLLHSLRTFELPGLPWNKSVVALKP